MLDFVSSQEWKSHSTDLSPLHYSVWDTLQELVYEGRHEPFANSKIFRMLSQANGMMSTLNSHNQKSHIAVEKCLAAVAKENGGLIQHIFCPLVDWWFGLLWRFSAACVQAATHMMKRMQKLHYCMWCYFVCNTEYRSVLGKKSYT